MKCNGERGKRHDGVGAEKSSILFTAQSAFKLPSLEIRRGDL